MIDWNNKQAQTDLPAHLGEGQLAFKNIGEINIIFGPNGSGKSQIMRALNGDEPESHHLVSPERPGDFQYNASYASDEESAATRRSSRLNNLTPDYRQRALSRLSVIVKARGAIKSPLPDTHFDVATEFLAILLPDFTLKYVGLANKDFAIYRSTGEEVTASLLSSGEADLLSVGIDMVAMCLLWKIKGIGNPVLFLDEPNVHLHPDLDAKLASGIKFLHENFNVKFFVSSHSTSLLSSIIGVLENDVRLFYIKKGPAVLSGVQPNKNLKTIASIMGGSTVLGGIFGLKMVLVEGDDDFEVWNQAVRSSGSLRISIMPPSGGKSIQISDRRILTGLFSAMGNSNQLGYILQDRDDRTGNPRNQPGGRMPMLWFSCREAENLTLASEVLTELGYSITAAKEKILEQGMQAEKVDQIFNDRKMSKISKDDMIVIQAALFHQNSRWQSMLGKFIGRAKPTGELADFIGDRILEAFWPE